MKPSPDPIRDPDAEVHFFGPDRVRVEKPDRTILIDYTQGDDCPAILEYVHRRA